MTNYKIKVPEAANDFNESTVLAVIEAKNLVELLIIPEQMPDDYYSNPVHVERMDSAIDMANSLVYQLDEDGRKKANGDIALFRKYAKTNKSWALNVFRSVTEKAKSWQDTVYGKSGLLESAADGIKSRFDELEADKLKQITCLMLNLLASYRDEIGVKPEYQQSNKLAGVAKLSGFLTDSGKLTTKAIGLVKTIANGELAEQTRIEARLLLLENACLKAEITPLQKEHFGSVFYADENLFQEKLQELINVELSRKAEMEDRIRRQQEAENQRILDAKLAEQQAEANRIAREEQAKLANIEAVKMVEALKAAEKLRAPKPDLVSNNYGVHSENLFAKRQEERDDKKNFVQTVVSLPVVANGRKLVRFDVRFELSVPVSFTNERIEAQIRKMMPEKLADALKRFTFVETV